jgi:hypothetical protein
MQPAAEEVFAALERHGLLLKQDKALPSVAGLITGEALSTSWWSHPKGRLIFAVLDELADHPDVLMTKLLHRKDTLVHRALWPALLAVAAARDAWQTRGLSSEAKSMLARLDRGEGPVRASGAAVKELEVRLLATTRQVHTESGKHEVVLESWPSWAARTRCEAMTDVQIARDTLEASALRLGAPPASLPWTTR